jgi:hypothetical protein
MEDFHLAAGESFADAICPPVVADQVRPHECCQVLWKVLGETFTPTNLATMSIDGRTELATAFASHFNCDPPSDRQIRNALDATLVRWPLDSLDE